MIAKTTLIKDLVNLKISPTDTVLVHSSMKAIGNVSGGADMVIDTLSDYLEDGLLIFPTHTWAATCGENSTYNPLTEPSCVGLLSNIFLKKEDVLRSLHPTHSVAALGKMAEEYLKGEEFTTTPCSRHGCWGKLYDYSAKLLFIGCGMTSNTYIHGVEEWNNVKYRLTTETYPVKIVTKDGVITQNIHHHHPNFHVSDNYGKILTPLISKGCAWTGKFGNANTIVCDAKSTADLVTSFLEKDPQIFSDKKNIPKEWYQ